MEIVLGAIADWFADKLKGRPVWKWIVLGLIVILGWGFCYMEWVGKAV